VSHREISNCGAIAYGRPLLQHKMIRSLLFAPGNSERKLERALTSGADAVILDLEDSVSATQKAAARALVTTFLRAHAPHRTQHFYVRVNPIESVFFESDLAAVMAEHPDGILLPKSEPKHVRSLSTKLATLEDTHGIAPGSVKIICIATETPSSIFALGSYLGTSDRLAGLAWGAEDLAASLGAVRTEHGFDDVYRLARTLCLLGAAAAGVEAFDTVYLNYKNTSGLRDESAAARRSGFAGKLAIHPDQVPTINDAFSPTKEEIAWANRVISSFESNPDAGAIGIDGEMVDRPHYILAQRILSRVARSQ
jgi:citrate lyase subunit beta/citryl-CoA lyase